MHTFHPLSRRAFLGSAAATLAMTQNGRAEEQASRTAAGSQSPATAQGHPLAVPGYFGSRPGVQLGTQLPATASEDDMRFTRQLGVEWVMTGLPPAENTLENYQALIRRFAAQGLKIYRL